MSDWKLEVALAWLDTTRRTPLVRVWCPRPGRRCRLGTVYATPHGLLLDGWQHTKVATSVDGPPQDRTMRRAMLLDQGGERVAYGASCRHGQPTMSGLVDVEPLLEFTRDVLAGKVTRPGDYTAR
jgi:hypothetical protein